MGPSEISDERERRLRDALASFERAIDKYPYSPEYWSTRAWIEDELGEAWSTIRSLRKAVELWPDYAIARYNLACAISKVLSQELDPEERTRLTREAVECLRRIPDQETDIWDHARADVELSSLLQRSPEAIALVEAKTAAAAEKRREDQKAHPPV